MQSQMSEGMRNFFMIILLLNQLALLLRKKKLAIIIHAIAEKAVWRDE